MVIQQGLLSFRPAKTGNWKNYHTAYIGIEGVSGDHDVTFVANGAKGVLNLAWIEFSDFPKRSDAHARIAALEYSDRRGIAFGEKGNLGYFDNGDYVTYSSINFGQAGTTHSMNINYAKSRSGGKVEIRLGGSDEKIIGEYKPADTRSWVNYINVNVPLDSIEDTHDIIFVAKDRRHGVLNLDWFELLETFLFKFTIILVLVTKMTQETLFQKCVYLRRMVSRNIHLMTSHINMKVHNLLNCFPLGMPIRMRKLKQIYFQAMRPMLLRF